MQMYGWRLSPSSKDKWIEEPNVGLGFIPTSSKDKAPLTPPLKGENLITLIPSIHVQ